MAMSEIGVLMIKRFTRISNKNSDRRSGRLDVDHDHLTGRFVACFVAIATRLLDY